MKHKLPLLIVSYFVIGCIWLWATPPFESSDEYKHYPVVHHIQTKRRLVSLDPDNPGRWQQEGAQPPLYYLLMAALTAPIDTSDLDQVYQRNRHAFIGDPNQIRNKNIMLHDPIAEAFPSSGSVRAVYVIRLVSLLLGCITIWFSFRLTRLLASEEIALLAATLTAFNPMFLFTSAAVNNDSLANMLGAIGLFLLIKLWLHYFDRPDAPRPYRLIIALGIVLGLGMSTKLSLGGLLLLAGLAVALLAWHGGRWRILFVDGLAIFIIAVTLLTPWLLYNIATYGVDDFTAINTFIEVQGTRTESMTWQDWRGEFGTFYRSFWGLFGGVNVAAPQPLYYGLNALFLVSIFSWIAKQQKRNLFITKGAWLAVAWILILLILLVRWTLISPAFQGRLIFPALSAINALFAIGLAHFGWVIGRQRFVLAIVAGVFITIAVALPFSTLNPAYAYPQVSQTIPKSAKISPISFSSENGIIELVGAELEQLQSRVPGDAEPLEVTLYWHSAETTPINYLTSINVLGRNLEVVGRVDRFPGWGMWPTSRWKQGEVYRDDYAIYLSPDAVAPSLLQFKIDVWNPETEEHLTATDSNDTELNLVTVGEARLYERDVQLPEVKTNLNAKFEEGIVLLGYDMPEVASTHNDIPVTLVWKANEQVNGDYTIFLQLLNVDGQLVGSGDGKPVNNQFYPTRLWDEGDVVVDDKAIALDSAELPAGFYTIAVGLYDANSQQRLKLLNGEDNIRWEIELVTP